jgi:hypothetical protein
MSRITGEVDLSRVPTENYDSKLGLRVAVFRNGKQLASTDLEAPATPAARVSFAVDFEPVTVVGVGIPCPVTVVIGPQLSARELLAIDTIKHVVNFAARESTGSTSRRRTRSAGEATEAVNIGSVAVDPNIYLCWIYCCQTYTIRGRLVCREWSYNPRTQQWSFCDNPVPGATVYIYDVHCFFWWCWRNLIGTATTDINGNFIFTFRWCCFRWFPWLEPTWVLDQSLYQQISQLLTEAHLPQPPNPPGPGPDPAILQSIVASAARPSRSAPATRRSSAFPTSTAPNSLSRETLLSVLPASPELEALHVWPWWPWYDCGPNIVFGATQICRDRLETVYFETNDDARWDIATNTSVTLVASDSACCRPVCHEPPCPECLVFSWVCDVPSDQISTSGGPPDLRGYAYTSLPSPGDWVFTQDLQIRGDLGAGIDYYKVQYSFNGGVWTDLPVPAFEGFPIAYFDPGLLAFVWVPGGFNPEPKSGQTVMISRDHYAALHALPTIGGQVDWNDFDTLFYFNTLAPVIADGLYQLRLVGYTADASDNLTNERVVNLCGSEAPATLELFVDNRHSVHPPPTPTHPYGSTPICPSPFASNHICTLEPDCYFRQICKNEGLPDEQCFAACDIITLKPTDTLTLHFTVACPSNANDGHLGGYALQAFYAYSDVLTIGTAASSAPCPALVTDPRGAFEADPPSPSVQLGPTYVQALAQGAPRPLWYGGDYKVTLRGCDFPESCAYDFQLCAWKRTTNGCTFSGCLNLDYNVFDLTLTILLAP